MCLILKAGRQGNGKTGLNVSMVKILICIGTLLSSVPSQCIVITIERRCVMPKKGIHLKLDRKVPTIHVTCMVQGRLLSLRVPANCSDRELRSRASKELRAQLS